MRVLVVDDDPSVRESLRRSLVFNGYQVELADHGEHALRKVASTHPDVVVLDVMMPRMDGYEVCSRFRDQRPDAAIPVIMLTAKSLDADRAMAFTAGADDWVTKPFDPADLVSRVKAHLRAQGAAVG